MLLNCQSAVAADHALIGKDIYRKQCAKCHGRNGEGVKDKYDDPLVGDWSLEKIIRVIEKTMPDDHPGTCKGEDARAVARYVYDAFYSRDARARTHPARVELVHLTNRQYLNTVGDLLKHFTGGEIMVAGEERGLRASYYSSRNTRKSDLAIDRVDRQINFDFGAGSPDTNKIKPPEFAIEWRGSVIAEETGEYEFILKTPNGASLTVNSDDQPLIDARVASGDMVEHTGTIRLMGGRAYPIRLEMFKAKDKTASVSLLWKPPHGALELIPARNLSPQRVGSTLVVATAFPADDSSVGYERGVAVSQAWDDATTQGALEVAAYVSRNLDRLSHSKAEDPDRPAKLETFCQEFMETAFRRPLTAEQKRVFISNQFKNAPKPGDAVTRVVLLTLKSPRFLYLGLEGAKPDDFAVAQRMSFDLWDSLPDRQLTKLAAQGALHTQEQVTQQTDRMLSDPRAHAKMQYFFHQWLQVNHVDDLSKDASLYPGFSPAIISDLRTSLNLFLSDTFWSPTSDYRNLLLADYLYMNDRLAKFYSIDDRSTNVMDEFIKVTLDPKERSGVVTHPYLLAEFSHQKTTSPIHRGVFLTRNIVGRSLRPPPMAMAFKDSEFAPGLSMREKIAQLTRPQACQSCHAVINPLGFSLEHYDAVGRFRDSENGKPINSLADYTTDEGETIRFSNARELADFATRSPQAQTGFIEQMFKQVVKQPMLAYGPDLMKQLHQSFVSSGFNMRKLLGDITVVSALHGVEKPAVSPKKS